MLTVVIVVTEHWSFYSSCSQQVYTMYMYTVHSSLSATHIVAFQWIVDSMFLSSAMLLVSIACQSEKYYSCKPSALV